MNNMKRSKNQSSVSEAQLNLELDVLVKEGLLVKQVIMNGNTYCKNAKKIK